METVLIGRFEKGRMIMAKPSKIIGERCNQGIKEIIVAEPKENDVSLKYVRPNHIHMGNQPNVMDPFEQRNIKIRNGNMGDTVYSNKNFVFGDLIAYYSGHVWNVIDQPLLSKNKTLSET